MNALREDKHCASHTLDVYFSGDRVDWDSMELDLEIRRSFVKRCMCRGRDDPVVKIEPQPTIVQRGGMEERQTSQVG